MCGNLPNSTIAKLDKMHIYPVLHSFDSTGLGHGKQLTYAHSIANEFLYTFSLLSFGDLRSSYDYYKNWW